MAWLCGFWGLVSDTSNIFHPLQRELTVDSWWVSGGQWGSGDGDFITEGLTVMVYYKEKGGNGYGYIDKGKF